MSDDDVEQTPEVIILGALVKVQDMLAEILGQLDNFDKRLAEVERNDKPFRPLG